MRKITLQRIVLLMVLALTVQTYSFAQNENTVRNEQTYRIRNLGTGNYLAYDAEIGKYAPALFDAADETQVHRFMTNTTVIADKTYYTIDMGGPDLSRGAMRISGDGAKNQVFSTTKKFDDTSGMSDKVQNVTELGDDIILIQAKDADSYLRENDQAFFDVEGFWYQAPVLDATDDRQKWLLEPGDLALSAEDFDTSSIFISNPVNDLLSIKGLTANENKVSVFNLLGSSVLTKNIDGESTINLNVSGLAAGMYIVKLQGDNGSFSKKIVKQ